VNVLVSGGTGTLGRLVVMRLRQSGHRARILSRHPRGHVDAVQGDLTTGAGLVKAVAGMDAIIHAASATRQPLRLRAVDVVGTRRLLAMAREANVRHVVYVSIVGIDRVNYPYYWAKRAAEAVVKENIVPWTILRATQFHNFLEWNLANFSRVPGLTVIPFDWKFQPVEAGEVARRLTEVVLKEPSGMLPDFGGPEVHDLKTLAEAWIARRKLRKRLVKMPMPLSAGARIADGALTCPDHKDGKVTWTEYLADRYPDQ
jgi:uncharacterized protein YbjT (DUF2867 family)